MNNIILLKDWDYGGSRTAKKGQHMRVDPATKKRLIEEGVAQAYTPAVEVTEKTISKPAKALPKDVKPQAQADLQKNS